jgi:intracellular multiplication protein IcmO
MAQFNRRKHEFNKDEVLQDSRYAHFKFVDDIRKPTTIIFVMAASAVAMLVEPLLVYIADILLFYNAIYFSWATLSPRKNDLPFKMPKSSNIKDPNHQNKPAEGILYIGNEEKTNEEIWLNNSDARTHILYLGTTGAGKTEGLKSLATNALSWSSGFVFVDGKADTDLWGSLSGLTRRFGRDDDLLVLNYMTGNSDVRTASNTINPFNQGSASYLSNLLVSLMPESGGDNAMWKDRAVALISALMPVLTWRRDHLELPLNISVIRESILLKEIIKLSRDTQVPEKLRKGLTGYLNTLPSYGDHGYNDDGTQKQNPQGGAIDYNTVDSQHGYLSMQFTRQLQSLADDYGYIFESPSADIDMMDVVLNRRILVVLIPALEKSSDEIANLGKIVGTMLKGMMGATLGSTVEGDTEMALENKPTRSSTPFMAIFDEVGYYTTQGMGVMAAQARSLGFCLVFAGQDLPAMEKRVKEEARSIVANCNLKIFGKLEDPTQTKEFFEKTVGTMDVLESNTRKKVKAIFGVKKFDDTDTFSVASRPKASYDQLKSFKEGQAIVTFGDKVIQARMFYSNIGKIKSLRVNKFISIPPSDPNNKRNSKEVDAILERVRDKNWTAKSASGKTTTFESITKLLDLVQEARQHNKGTLEAMCYAVTRLSGVTPESQKAAVAAKSETPPVAAAKTPEQPPKPLTALDEDEDEVTPSVAEEISAIPDEKTKKGTEETLSWEALLKGDKPDKQSSSSTSSPEPKSMAEKAASLPSVAETVKWEDLFKEEPAKPSSEAALPNKGGFGIGSIGTGYGGFGGIGSLGNLAGTTPPASKSSQPKKIDDALEKGETINWKDLAD